jgi:hypothetical protein
MKLFIFPVYPILLIALFPALELCSRKLTWGFRPPLYENTLQRLQSSIDSCDLQIINMHKDGDGLQTLVLFAWPVDKVLCELIGGMR